MNVLLFGATGMVGDGVLHECLGDARVTRVTAVVRSPLGITHPKLREVQRRDFLDYSDFTDELRATDACYFCLGVSAMGLTEAEYTKVTFDFALAVGRALAAVKPGATFCYVTGEGTDSTEKGPVMWARVKGRTENALIALPLGAYMFRPGFIRGRKGKASKTRLYRMFYPLVAPFYPVLRRLAPTHVTTVENIGRAMIAVSIGGYSSRILENTDINALAGESVP